MKRRHATQGFTLVEVALALLVIGVGIVGVFGLFPAGLEASRRTVNETQAAIFAEEVFGGFRAAAGVVPWTEFDKIEVPIACSNLWASTRRVGKTSDRTPIVWRHPSETNLVERALRYQLSIGNASGGDVKALTLKVYPGEFGGTDEEYVFYTEIWRRQP